MVTDLGTTYSVPKYMQLYWNTENLGRASGILEHFSKKESRSRSSTVELFGNSIQMHPQLKRDASMSNIVRVRALSVLLMVFAYVWQWQWQFISTSTQHMNIIILIIDKYTDNQKLVGNLGCSVAVAVFPLHLNRRTQTTLSILAWEAPLSMIPNLTTKQTSNKGIAENYKGRFSFGYKYKQEIIRSQTPPHIDQSATATTTYPFRPLAVLTFLA